MKTEYVAKIILRGTLVLFVIGSSLLSLYGFLGGAEGKSSSREAINFGIVFLVIAGVFLFLFLLTFMINGNKK